MPLGTSRAIRRACAAKRLSSDPARAKTGEGKAPRRSHNGSWVPVPHNRRLEARPDAVLRRRSDLCAAPPDSNRSNRGPRNHASMKPSTSPEASRSSASFSSDWRRLRASGRVLNARGHADEDDMAQRQIGSEGRMQGDPGTERVAEEGAWLVADLRPYRLGHEARCRRKVGPYRSGLAVTGQIDRHQGARCSPASPRKVPRGDPSG